MKRGFFILIFSLIAGIFGALGLLWPQNIPIASAQSLPLPMADENITEPIDPNIDYLGLLELYAVNQCDEQTVSGDYSNICLDIIDRINLDEKNFSAEQAALGRQAGTAAANRVTEKNNTESQKKTVVAKPRFAGVGGVGFTNDPQRISCHLKEDNHPSRSDNKGDHYDEDCCIDKDEWLEPGCVYLHSDFNVSLNSRKSAPPFHAKN